MDKNTVLFLLEDDSEKPKRKIKSPLCKLIKHIQIVREVLLLFLTNKKTAKLAMVSK